MKKAIVAAVVLAAAAAAARAFAPGLARRAMSKCHAMMFGTLEGSASDVSTPFDRRAGRLTA